MPFSVFSNLLFFCFELLTRPKCRLFNLAVLCPAPSSCFFTVFFFFGVRLNGLSPPPSCPGTTRARRRLCLVGKPDHPSRFRFLHPPSAGHWFNTSRNFPQLYQGVFLCILRPVQFFRATLPGFVRSRYFNAQCHQTLMAPQLAFFPPRGRLPPTLFAPLPFFPQTL